MLHQPESPLISVIVVTWNARRYVERCVRSLAENTHVPAEIIVVDNASSDGTPELIEKALPAAILIHNRQNLGFARGNNLGIARSRGQYLFLINSDVAVPPGCFEQLLAFMEADPTIGMLGPQMLDPQARVQRSTMRFPTLWNQLRRALALDTVFHSGGFLMPDFPHTSVRDVDVLNGWFWVVRRQALEQVGPLDEQFFMYGEDIDWCYRFHQAGWRRVFCPVVGALHFGGASSAAAPIRFAIEMQRANFQYWEKHHGWPARATYYSITLLHQVLRVGGYSLSYLVKAGSRPEAAFKVRRSLAMLRWLLILAPPSSVSKPPALAEGTAIVTQLVKTPPAASTHGQHESASALRDYVLITAAHNEEKYIEATIRSVIAQTLLPRKWIIVSDASSDCTDEIVQKYAAQHAFIELLRLSDGHARNFGAQVDAIHAGYTRLKALPFGFVGNVDADVALPPDYYQSLLRKFAENPQLGLAGGFIHEDYGKGFQSRPTNRRNSVAHATQLFRRECFEAIGGYLRLPYGGPDWVAEIMARQRGWTVEAFPALAVRHYRPSASAGGVLRGCFRQGRMDQSLGSLPLFELIKCLRRLLERPVILGAFARLLGFTYAVLTGAPRLVPEEIAQHLRQEQRMRLRAALGFTLQTPPAESAQTVATTSSSSGLPQNARLSD